MRHLLPLLLVAAACGDDATTAADVTPDAGSAETDVTPPDVAAPMDVAADLEQPAVDTGEPEVEDASDPPLHEPLNGCPDGPALSAALSIGAVAPAAEPGRQYAAACGRVVWASTSGALLLDDLTTGKQLILATAGSAARWPDMDGLRVVYAAGDPPQIVLHDLATGTAAPLDPTAAPQLRPRISGDTVAWEDERDGLARIRVHRGGGSEVVDPETTAEQRFADVDGERIVWTDFRDDPDGSWTGDGTDQTDIWTATAQDGPAALVAADHKQAFPELDGDDLIWLDWRNIPHELGHPRPEPKRGHFELWTGHVTPTGIEGDLVAIPVYNGSYAALPTLVDGFVAWSSASGIEAEDHRIRGLSLADSVVLDLSPEGTVADRPVLAPSLLLYTTANTLHATPLE